ncbi:MAG: ABC transporter permease [Planctomycetes bacterium]|nr:ABC transporter permease [Planctomycetota bacterium]
MIRLITSRLLQLPLILAVVFTVTFVLAWIVPGDPLSRPDGRRPSPEIEAAMKRQYNLDNPWRFAGQYITNVATKGDFGPSLQYLDQRVGRMIAEGLPVSATVGGVAIAMALVIGVGVGVIGALRPGSVLDMAGLVVALIGVSLPTFVTGAILLMVFSVWLNWVNAGAWEHWTDVLLPALTLSLAPAAYIARLIRLGLADVMSSDFVRTARAKGLSDPQVLFRHALKVAFLPVLSFLGPAAAVTMTGSFVVERIFNLHGIGQHFVDAVKNKDQFLLLGVVLVYATMLIVFNLIVDVAYAWVDPRIEL